MYRQIEQLVHGKRVLLLGFGREGQSTYRYLQNFQPARLGIADQKPPYVPKGAAVHTGADYQKAIADYDVVFKSPGIVLEACVKPMLSKITSQTDQMLKRYRSQIVGITGTKGKSTVATLTYHVLKHTRGDALLMGNIGIPAFDMLEQIGPDTVLVYELSCHQLEYARCSPHIAVLLNLFEEHLDHYGSFERYAAAKRHIYEYQEQGDVLFCNLDCLPAGRRAVSLSLHDPAADIYPAPDALAVLGERIAYEKLASALLGKHNMLNIGVAYGVCKQFGVPLSAFGQHLKTYRPLPHRLELVGEVDGVRYYDDSISTVSETTIQGLQSVSNVSTLILGGMDRGIDYRPLLEFLRSYPLKTVIFMYDTGRLLYAQAQKALPGKQLVLVDNLYQAVQEAKRVTPKGTACLLSPAAASYGVFKNFEERGALFKQYVLAEEEEEHDV